MKTLSSILLLGAAVLAAPALAQAQNAPAWVAAPPGFSVVMVPDAGTAASPPAASLPVMPDPQAMIQQIDAMMAQAQQEAAAMQAQFAALQQPAAQSGGVVITTVSDGTHSCTQRILYPSDGGRPQIELTSTANGCALEGLGRPAPATPVLLPTTKLAPAAPRLIEAENSTGEVKLADRN
jgi:hypothetical protein